MYYYEVAVPKARTVIRGRYRLESMIGEGGMASVWRAKDLTLARSVAVKLLFARDDRDRNALTARFLREARIAAAVQHRNVIQIVDFGTTEEELPFMVMELLEGEPLSGRMHRERRLPMSDAVHIANLTLRGLSAVHQAGIIHRDLKPDNIYLKRENEAVYPKILDFGISRSVEPQSGRRSALTTREGLIIGTPEYMSPEQARGVRDIDPRSDIYSMGVILYEALSGRLPFYSENVGDLIIKVVTGTAQNLHELLPEIPVEISDVVMRAMARHRNDRFQSAEDMQAALTEAAERANLEAGPRVLSDMPPRTDGAARITPSQRTTLDEQVSEAPERATTDAYAIVPPVTQTLKTGLIGLKTISLSKRRWALLLMAAAVAGYSLIALIRGRSSDPGSPVANDLPKPAAPVVAATTSTIELRGVPDGAQISFDGRPGGAKWTVPRSQRMHALEVSMSGKQPYRISMSARQDLVIQVALEDAVTERAKPAPKPRARVRPSAAKTAKAGGALRNLDF